MLGGTGIYLFMYIVTIEAIVKTAELDAIFNSPEHSTRKLISGRPILMPRRSRR